MSDTLGSTEVLLQTLQDTLAGVDARAIALIEWSALAVNFAKAWDAYMAVVRGTEAETLELYKACAAARAAMGPL